MPLKVLAFVDLVVIDENGIGPIDPTPRSPISLTDKHAHDHRNGEPLALKKLPLYSQFSCPQRTTCTASCVRYWSTQGRKGSQSCVCLSRPDAQAATPARPGAT